MPIVDKFYSPEMTIIDSLVTKHYPKTQLRKILKLFRTNFRGQEFKDVDAKFKKVVLLEQAQNKPLKPDDTQEIIKKRKKDLENQSKDGAKKAQAAQQQAGVMTQKQAIQAFNDQIGDREDEENKNHNKNITNLCFDLLLIS